MYIPVSRAPCPAGKMKMTVVTGTHSLTITFSYMHFTTHYNCHSGSSNVLGYDVGGKVGRIMILRIIGMNKHQA